MLQCPYVSSPFPPNWIPPVRPIPSLFPPSLTSFCRSIFRVLLNTLFPSPALPPLLQSHWPILWRTVKDRRGVYCVASFLGQWDNAGVCMLPSPLCFAPPLLQGFMEMTLARERGGWPCIFTHLLVLMSKYKSTPIHRSFLPAILLGRK